MTTTLPPTTSDIYARIFVNLKLDDSSMSSNRSFDSGLYLPDDHEIFSFISFPYHRHFRRINPEDINTKEFSIWIDHWGIGSGPLKSLINMELFAERSARDGLLKCGMQIFISKDVMQKVRKTFDEFRKANYKSGHLSVIPSEKIGYFLLEPYNLDHSLEDFVLRVLCPKETKPVFPV